MSVKYRGNADSNVQDFLWPRPRLLDRLEEAEATDHPRVAVDRVVVAGTREVERELERGRGAAAEVLSGRGRGQGSRQERYSSRHGLSREVPWTS